MRKFYDIEIGGSGAGDSTRKGLKIEWDENVVIAEDENGFVEGFIGRIEGTGIVETGITKEAAIEQILVSLAVLFAYQNGLPVASFIPRNNQSKLNNLP